MPTLFNFKITHRIATNFLIDVKPVYMILPEFAVRGVKF
jgi:hypothetical protein